MKLKGQVALITGSAQGIGKSIAVALAKEGANIIISDINLELSEKTAQEIQTLGVKTKAVKLNVTDPDEAEKTIKEIHAEFGKIDILVNNAGITKDTLFIRMKKEDWDLVININLTGAFNISKIIVPLMMKQRSGKIINISSIVGERGNAGQTNYSSLKAGLLGFTKSLAREVASRGITVNAIAPGFIDTEMTKKLSEDVKAKMLAQVPLAKLGLPEDVANSCVFLAGPDAAYITGQVINVNGGMYM